ncbi:hypothetical protein Pint_06750 [Pistacia integerrima]|uniref:Uncharacterized protein n=1 Tax=Pistacia integerrima TaxID=434235 RepID=A0ACC0XYZ6_9ROSI|nr:hypothetical protein Pint_06750 [Pistacia integerrima]
MDTTTSEYLFCDDFLVEESIFYEIFAGPFAVINEHFNSILPNCYDAIGLMLMICIIHQHQAMLQALLIMSWRRIPCLDSYLDKVCYLLYLAGKSEQVNISLWPRFKMVFYLHLGSLRNENVRTLWEDDIHRHYVMRCYAEFTASLVHLNVEYGDGQLAKMFPRPKLQIVFLINNYDMTIAVLKESICRCAEHLYYYALCGSLFLIKLSFERREASPECGKIQMHFEELLKSNTALFVVSNDKFKFKF